MTIEEKIKLIDAGYTKAEIEEMADPQSEQTDSAADENTEQNTAKENAQNEEKSEVNEQIKALNETVKTLTDTVKALQDSNIKNAKGEKPDTKSVIDETIKNFMESM